MVVVGRGPVLDKLRRQVAYTQPISVELDRESSSPVKETSSFIIDLMINAENCRVYSSAIACNTGVPVVLSWYGSIRE
jgi:hypothetical protein